MTQNRGRILLVDDDPGLLRLLSIRLRREGYTVETAQSGHHALKVLKGFLPSLVITDLRMNGMDGSQLLDEIQLRWPGLPVLLITAHGTIPDAVTATQRGAIGFLTKPLDKHELMEHINRAVEISPGATRRDDWRKAIIGCSNAMERILAQAYRIAPSKVSVLITGASGTGKEVLARVIHQASGRGGSFIALNAGAIPAELLESELFGHERGSFTGASRERVGLIQCAHGGTLFLDEIGDMPALLQVKLLRVLQDGEIRPVGSNRDSHVDVRVISATHRDLERQIEEGGFREDLYYRLKVVHLTLPALVERRQDIPLLVAHFLERLAPDPAMRKTFAPKAMEILAAADWPGNVRQLSNVVEQSYALAPGRVIGARLVLDALGTAAQVIQPYSEARAEFTRNYLCQLLQINHGNVSAAARMAERNRSDFYKLLARHQVDPAAFKNAE